MRKQRKFNSLNKVIEVSDDEYQRLSAKADAKFRTEAKKRVPRSERRKSPIEASIVSDEEYAKLADAKRIALRESATAGGFLGRFRKQRKSIESGDPAETVVSPEEYRRLTDALLIKSEDKTRRQEQLIETLQRIFNPITIAIIILGGICIYFLVEEKHLNLF